MSWPGANSIEDGIIVDLGLMNKTTYNAETKIASIEPGPRWIEVYQELEKRECRKPFATENFKN